MAREVTTTTAHPEPGTGGKLFPPLDPGTFGPQLVWLALSFGLLYLLLSRMALPRIRDVLEERAERIQRDLKLAEKLKGQTEQALKNYEQALISARGKASSIAKGVRDNLGQEIDKERAKVEAQIAHKVADAEARIAQTKSRALASVNDIAADAAGAIVARLLGKEVSKDEVKKALVQRAAE
jgi:F-type H+-transporting ATPase subunit b